MEENFTTAVKGVVFIVVTVETGIQGVVTLAAAAVLMELIHVFEMGAFIKR